MAKLLLVIILSYTMAKSPQQSVSNEVGLNFFWYTSTPDGVPTINGRFELTDPSTKFQSNGEIRIGLEIAKAEDKFKWRDQMIFFGPVADKKFTTAKIGKKVGASNLLTYYKNWV